ncbi:hypothetical protein FRB99_006192 [Tulasnella sp. 403]|nr:hypothetical protein FRB99_006192 [Tulasnella sp. 403]
MTDTLPNLADLCRSLPASAQSQILTKHVLSLLDTLDIPSQSRDKLIEGIDRVKLRWSHYPKHDWVAQRQEINDLMARLRKLVKIRTSVDALHEHNEIVTDLVYACTEWLKQLWIVGVEFGQGLETVHEAFLHVELAFERTDGDIIEEIKGHAAFVIRNATLFVWQQVFLAQLVKPENQNHTQSWFVAKRMPAMFQDIVQVYGAGMDVLLAMQDAPDPIDEDDDASSYSDHMPDIFHDNDMLYDSDEGDDEDDDDMPPLVDIHGNVQPSTNGANSASNSDDDDMPPLTDGEDSSCSCRAHHKAKKPADEDPHPSGSEVGTDFSFRDSPITTELDEECNQREGAYPRLCNLVYSHIKDVFKRQPTESSWGVLRKAKDMSATLKAELLQHLAAMCHTPETFVEATKILISQAATQQITRLVSLNGHLSSRVRTSMQSIALYYASRQTTRERAGPLILGEMKVVVQDMIMEIEFGFQGLRNPTKLAEGMTAARLPASERVAAVKRWVDEIETPQPDSLSPAAQAAGDGGNPIGLGPFPIFDFLGGIGQFDTGLPTPLAADPLEAIEANPGDSDFAPLLDRYRPNMATPFEQWQETLSAALALEPKGCAKVAQGVYKELVKLAPWITSKVVVAEMRSRCKKEKLKYRSKILGALHSFAVQQFKASKTGGVRSTRDAAPPSSTSGTAGASSSGAGSTALPFPLGVPITSASASTAGGGSFFSFSAGINLAALEQSALSATSSAAATTGSAAGPPPPPQDISNMFNSLLSLTIPLSYLGLNDGNGEGEDAEPTYDDVD